MGEGVSKMNKPLMYSAVLLFLLLLAAPIKNSGLQSTQNVPKLPVPRRHRTTTSLSIRNGAIAAPLDRNTGRKTILTAVEKTSLLLI